MHVPRDLWCHVASRRGPSSLCLRSKADQQASCIFTRAGECCANPCGEGLAVTQQRRNTRVTVVRPLSRHRGSNASWSYRSLFMNRETLIRFADVGLCVRSPRGRGRWVGICKRYVQNFEFRPTSHTVECRAKSPSGPERGMVSGALRAACAHAEEPGARHFDARCRRHRCVARARREARVVAC